MDFVRCYVAVSIVRSNKLCLFFFNLVTEYKRLVIMLLLMDALWALSIRSFAFSEP